LLADLADADAAARAEVADVRAMLADRKGA